MSSTQLQNGGSLQWSRTVFSDDTRGIPCHWYGSCGIDGPKLPADVWSLLYDGRHIHLLCMEAAFDVGLCRQNGVGRCADESDCDCRLLDQRRRATDRQTDRQTHINNVNDVVRSSAVHTMNQSLIAFTSWFLAVFNPLMHRAERQVALMPKLTRSPAVARDGRPYCPSRKTNQTKTIVLSKT